MTFEQRERKTESKKKTQTNFYELEKSIIRMSDMRLRQHICDSGTRR